jgi:D-alanyl-D-alanine carboxypeptidase/D-alanyl-D-alanine-endopeptidase (penicillin-binding protein 4)
MSRRLARAVVFVAAALLVWAGTAAAKATAASPALTARLAAALTGPGLSPARTSALAVDLRTEKVVFAQRHRLAVAPASNEKLLVAYAALTRLGPGYRFATEVTGDGEFVGKVWRGDLYLVGGGDPTLGVSDLDRLAAQLRGWGIRRVAGAVVGDETWFDARRDAPGWRPGFLGEESPPLSALGVDRAESWPSVEPALAAAVAFDAALERRGITVTRPPRSGKARGDLFPLARDLSEPLSEIVRFMNRESDNYTAELLLKQLGAAAGDGGTTAAGAVVVRDALARADIPLLGLRIADGSGLSRLDRLSATTLVALLRAAAEDLSIRDAFLSSLAVAGVSGTLERRLDRRPTYGRVIAKTGTTRISSSLAGFVRGRYAFAVLQSGRLVPTWEARAAQDRFVALLAGA